MAKVQISSNEPNCSEKPLNKDPKFPCQINSKSLNSSDEPQSGPKEPPDNKEKEGKAQGAPVRENLPRVRVQGSWSPNIYFLLHQVMVKKQKISTNAGQCGKIRKGPSSCMEPIPSFRSVRMD
jgi:hypothetical protein